MRRFRLKYFNVFGPERRSRSLSAFHWILHLVSFSFIAVTIHSGLNTIDTGQIQEEAPKFSVPEKVGDTELYFAEDNSVSKEMYAKHRVLCWIMTGPATHHKAKYVKETWGKRCNVLLFMSSEEDDSLPTVKLPVIDGRSALWGKTKEAFRYVWENYRDEADWFFKADDDTYAIMENLRYVLSRYNTSDPLYFGHKLKPYNPKGFMVGGAGYTLSKEALRRFAEMGLNDPKICNQSLFGSEDVEMGNCMANLNVSGVDTRDSYGRHRFLHVDLPYHMNAKVSSKHFWLWNFTYYPIKLGTECCSDTLVSFHYVNHDHMRVYDYLLYHVRPYGIVNYRTFVQKQPFPPPDQNLTETPFPGPSDEDNKLAEQYQKEEEELNRDVMVLQERAKMLDSNEALRISEMKRRRRKMQSHKTHG